MNRPSEPADPAASGAARRLLFADDHEIVRRGLASLISDRPDWIVVGEASDGRQAVQLAAKFKPDVAILDFAMPVLNGIETTRQILAASPETRVLILSMHESEQIVREVLEAGAQGYLLKSDAGRDLVRAIEALLDSKTYFTPSVARMLLDGYLSLAKPEGAAAGGRLSPREREIVQMLAEGQSNKEIAAGLGISVNTVETHRSNVMQKMGFRSITELVRFAVRNKMIEP
jgi:DNA-binding NarL/FixJ family response regulator